MFMLMFLLFVFASHSTSLPILTNFTDQEALLSFKEHITSDPNMVLTNWNQSIHFCNWNGIGCSKRRQRVTSINLPGLDLQGTITPHIANLSFLLALNLSDNLLHGSLPPEIGRLRRLTFLTLGRNRIEGKIPPSLGDCKNIRNLSLLSNQLHGNIPYQLGNLSRLIRLNLVNNFIAGTIPSLLGNLSNLAILGLAENHLQGNIPDALARVLGLQALDLTLNALSGLLPHFLFNFSSLRGLGLGENNLHGKLPKEMALPELELLSMGNNRLDGPIPVSLFNDSKRLKLLELARNCFHGSIPTSLGSKLPRIQWLNLENNSLVNEPGTKELGILTSLTNCRFLEAFGLSFNPLGGVLPKSVGNLSTYLTMFTIARSQIEGTIPVEIGNLSSLTRLILFGNSLGGSIPSEIGKLKNLQRLYLNDNRLGGTIPNQLGFLQSLGELFLDQNTLSGSIPDFVKNLTQLQQLYLDSNKLEGQIPMGAWRSQTLWRLNLSSNSLNGFLPPELGGLKSLVYFAVSSNRISGEIPSNLGGLAMLINLDLSRNLFQGQIPSTFPELISIEFLDISSNNLSGSIPMSLTSLRELKFLNISYNQLEGRIPNGGVFLNLTIQSIMGNLKLCGGGPKLELPTCPSDDSLAHPGTTSKLKKIIIIIVTATVGFSIFCYFSIRFYWKKKPVTNLSIDLLSLPEGNQRISHHELCLATDNFNETNLLGVGSVGSVYKGVLTDGTVIAIKVLNMQSERSFKSFNTECMILSRVRHRNLVKIITTCSNLDFRALVLQFMANGSLDKWLYPPTHDRDRGLGLLQRLDIMIDVANGMEYLHHDYSRPIVHCDLKPSNILLDQDIVAHIGDFGISRLMENLSLAPTSTIGTIGYIAPECGLNGRPSVKGDVYSYGILLLETFAKKRPTDSMFTGDLSLPKWMEASLPYAFTETLDKELWKEYRIDNRMEAKEAKLNCCLSIIKVGLSCAKDSAELRIDMRGVVSQLKSIKQKFVDSFKMT